MPPRPLPTVPDSRPTSGYQSPLKRFSVYSAHRTKEDAQQQSDNNANQLQYSESMPVLDAKAPYAVPSATKIHLSTSHSTRSFDSSSDHNYNSNRASGVSSPSSMHRQTANTTHSYFDDHQHGHAKNNSSPNLDNREKRNFLDSPVKRNSTSSPKKKAVPTPCEPEKLNVEVGSDERPDFHIKIVCVGDGGCGKTCLMLTYTYGTFPTTYIPTVFENYLTMVRAPNGKLIELALWDTAGQEEYDRLRVLSYPEVNILLVCFAINSPASLDNVVDKWIPEVSHFCQDIPFILVGLKSDLRKNPQGAGSNSTHDLVPISAAAKSHTNITVDQAKSVATRVGANRYMECSARLSDGISEVFNTAVSIVLAEHLGLTQPPIIDVPGATPLPDKAPASSAGAITKRPLKLPRHQTTKSHKPEIVTSGPPLKKKKKKSKCVIL